MSRIFETEQHYSLHDGLDWCVAIDTSGRQQMTIYRWTRDRCRECVLRWTTWHDVIYHWM